MKLKSLSWFAAGLAVGLPFMMEEARAAESIRVTYQEEEVTVTRDEISTFSETGTIPDALQELFDTDETLSVTFRDVLTREIKIPQFVENFLESKNGEFLFLQLDKAISSASGRTEDDLEALKSAVLSAISDREVSFLEIIDKHPMSTIRVDLTNLEGTYNDVSRFVERVLPTLEVAKGVLQDLVCDCETAPSASSPATQSNLKADPVRHAADPNCNQPKTTLTQATPAQP